MDDNTHELIIRGIAVFVFVIGVTASSCANSENAFCTNFNQKLSDKGVQI